MSIFDRVASTSGSNSPAKSNLFGNNDGSLSKNPVGEVIPDTPEDLNVDIGEKGILLKTFREPKAGSLLYKLKKGELKGRNASSGYENLIGDAILASQTKNLNFKAYMFARMGLGHNKSLQLAEDFHKGLTQMKIDESVLLNHLYDGNLSSFDEFSSFAKSQFAYHKDIIFSNAKLFAKIGLNI